MSYIMSLKRGSNMTVTLYYMSGSPYAWRAWLVLMHKGIAFTLRTMSYDAGDFGSEEFRKLTPRRRVPVLVDDGFALYESAAIVDYVEERWPLPSLFSADLRGRAIERRLIREADQYFAGVLERLVKAVLFTPEEKRDGARIAAICSDLKNEYALWETMIAGNYLSGALSAADYTLYPLTALIERMASRNPTLIRADLTGSRIAAWMRRMQALPIVQKTWPPHWK
jgi:glutathione S-transferase